MAGRPPFQGAFSFLNTKVDAGEITYEDALAFITPSSASGGSSVTSSSSSSSLSSSSAPAPSSSTAPLIRRQLSRIDSCSESPLAFAALLVREALEWSLRITEGGLVYLHDPAGPAAPAPSLLLPAVVLGRSGQSSGGGLLEQLSCRVDHEQEVNALLQGPMRRIEHLVDLYTEASGDCLLNALSLGMFGVHDRAPAEQLGGGSGEGCLIERAPGILRRALHYSLKHCKRLRNAISTTL